MTGDRKNVNEKVEALYREVARRLGADPDRAGACKACGRCCDFGRFGHKLFVSTPELLHFYRNVPEAERKAMAGEVCPYLDGGMCTVHAHRFLGCRIFCCSGEDAFQNELMEWALGQIKNICRGEEVPYRYMALKDALKEDGRDLPGELHEDRSG